MPAPAISAKMSAIKKQRNSIVASPCDDAHRPAAIGRCAVLKFAIVTWSLPPSTLICTDPPTANKPVDAATVRPEIMSLSLPPLASIAALPEAEFDAAYR